MRLFFFVLFNLSLDLFAQDISRARAHIDTLCSNAFFGRGYLKGGDQKAADYLADQFKKIGLHPLPGSAYQQAFPLTVNTFPQSPAFKWGNQSLSLGTEFLPLPQSGTGTGKAEACPIIDSLFQKKTYQNQLLKTDFSERALVMDLSSLRKVLSSPETLVRKLLTAACWVFTTEKITHSLAGYQLPIPAFVVASPSERVPKKVQWSVQALLKENYLSQNVIGYVPGTAHSERYFVYSAHYDHLGGVGDQVYFPGGNDNASGVALLLELAQHYVQNPSKQSVAFIAFGAEEAGLVGSKFFTENPLFPLKDISFLFNLDLTATGEKGGTIVNAKELPDFFDTLKQLNDSGEYLSYLGKRGKAANSDHYFFFEKGVPSFFLYLMGDWPHYHDVNDRPPLPLNRFAETYRLLIEFEQGF